MECRINARKAQTTFGSFAYKSVSPKINGGRAIRTTPENIIKKFNKSTFRIGSFKNQRAQNTVYIGAVEEIMVASAIFKCCNGNNQSTKINNKTLQN